MLFKKGTCGVDTALHVVGLHRVLNEQRHLRKVLLETSLAAFTTDFIVRADTSCGIIAVYRTIVADVASTARNVLCPWRWLCVHDWYGATESAGTDEVCPTTGAGAMAVSVGCGLPLALAVCARLVLKPQTWHVPAVLAPQTQQTRDRCVPCHLLLCSSQHQLKEGDAAPSPLLKTAAVKGK